MEISERTLRNVFLPPWVAGVREGALAVMATHPAIDGVPTHSSDWLLTTLLREELGFRGLVLSEGSGIHNLIRDKVAADANQAGEMALRAGVDVGISHERAYMDLLIRNVEEGRVPIKLIDRAVRRILTQKMRLGLFEKPYVDPEFAANGVPYEKHRELALEVARQGIVLLKNDRNVLPLRKDLGSIAVVGPNADDILNQLGDYTSGDQPHATRTFLDKVVTVLNGIKAKLGPKTKVRYVKGCDALGTKLDEIQAAVEAARQAEVALVIVGESHRGDGEMRDVASLDLPGLQEELIEAVHATGTPTVLVLINGRPLSVRWAAEHVPAIVEAWLSGEQGGRAVADVLFGDYNPSGRLPVTIPRHVGQLPMYYNYNPAKADTMKRGYVDMSPLPLWEFGYGLSYTNFEYSDLRIEPSEVQSPGQVGISLQLKNTGARAGQEVVQLYLQDLVSSVYRPVKELRRFEKVSLAAGEARRVQFELGAEDLSLLDRNLRRVVEPGTFAVMVGGSSQAIKLQGEFEVKP